MVKRPALRYHGGKWRLAPWVISHFPKHSAYVEPYGGGASVLLRKQRVPTEIYNDLDSEVVNVFRVLQNPTTAKELEHLLERTPFARDEYNLSFEPELDHVERARRVIMRSFMGHSSKSIFGTTTAKNAFRSLRTGDASPAVDWSRYPACIDSFVERLTGVVIENRPALQVIENCDRPDTLIYVDPPYVSSTRRPNTGKYRHEMDDSEHEVLARTLSACKGHVILSGYDCDLYRDLYGDWQCLTKQHRADKASLRTECLWISPNTPLPQGRLLEVV